MKKRWQGSSIFLALTLGFVIWQVGYATASVTLREFSAAPMNNFIRVHWETAEETEIVGFYVLSSEQLEGNYVPVSDLVLATGDPIGGGIYDWDDLEVVTGTTYYYQLEIVNSDQTHETPGTIVSATLGLTPTTATATPTATATATATGTGTQSSTATATATASATGNMTPTGTPTASATATTSGATPTATATGPTLTPSRTPTVSRTPTASPTATLTRTPTRTLTPTKTPTPSGSETITPTPTESATPTSVVIIFTNTPEITNTPRPTSTPFLTPTGTATFVPGPTPTPSRTPIPLPTLIPTLAPSDPDGGAVPFNGTLLVGLLCGAGVLVALVIGLGLYLEFGRKGMADEAAAKGPAQPK